MSPMATPDLVDFLEEPHVLETLRRFGRSIIARADLLEPVDALNVVLSCRPNVAPQTGLTGPAVAGPRGGFCAGSTYHSTINFCHLDLFKCCCHYSSVRVS
jgi:hypothetical protein